MDNPMKGFLEGLDIDKSTESAAPVIQALLANETNPEVRRIIMGLEPVDGLPGYYQNIKEKVMIKYQPDTNSQPTFMSGEIPSTKTSKIIKE